MDYYSFTDPRGWKAELASLADPKQMLYHEAVTCQPKISRRSGKVRQPKTDVLTTEPRCQAVDPEEPGHRRFIKTVRVCVWQPT